MKFIYKHYIKFIIGLVVLLFIVLPFASYKSFVHFGSGSKETKVQVKIRKSTGSDEIVSMLYHKGLISNKFYGKLYIKLHGLVGKLKPGVYMFNKGMNPAEIFNMLKNHIIDENYVKFTIPEGYNIRQIASKMVRTGLIKDTELFYNCVNNDKFNYSFLPKRNKNKTFRLEGYLYPATYEFEKGMTLHFMTDQMINRFALFYRSIKEDTINSKLSFDKIMTIASMIESEAKKDKDRALISAVIYNRLKADMKLQIDATVLYALGVHKIKVYLKDLKVDSPYNTYKNYGLPIGPISSPGEKSVKAALEPEKVNYLYYIAKTDGSHYFTNSYKNFLSFKKRNKHE